jgi:phytoene dehydrogenase-like protein
VSSYRASGGEALTRATVDEVLVRENRARGVRLTDGRVFTGDVVISTASAPETVLHLLGGRYDADATRQRMEHWKMFDPIVLASFGAACPCTHAPGLLFLDGIEPLVCGDRRVDHLYVRICNDDPSFAPPGHCVVQAMIPTDYEWWATRGPRYTSEKQLLAEQTLARLESYFPGLSSAVRVTDLATPLTFWNMAHSWRGAYEGWMPTSGSFFGHVPKVLDGLHGLYMAGQWVEPGGGVPMAVMSGRQAIQLVCRDQQRAFSPRQAEAGLAKSA